QHDWYEDDEAPIGAECEGDADHHDETPEVHRMPHQPIESGGHHLLVGLDGDTRGGVVVLHDHLHGDAKPNGYQHIPEDHYRDRHVGPTESMVVRGDNQ